MLLVLLSTLAYSHLGFSKEKLVKDPFGTKCKASDLTEVKSISKPMFLSELPSATPEMKKDKNKYVSVTFKYANASDTEAADMLGDGLIFKQNDPKVKKLRLGDKTYCPDSVMSE